MLKLWIFLHEVMPSRYTYNIFVFGFGIALFAWFIHLLVKKSFPLRDHECSCSKLSVCLVRLGSKHQGHNCTSFESLGPYVIGSARKCVLFLPCFMPLPCDVSQLRWMENWLELSWYMCIFLFSSYTLIGTIKGLVGGCWLLLEIVIFRSKMLVD